MGRITCFMLEETKRCRCWLRRFLSADTGGLRLCEPSGYHDALVPFGDAEMLISESGTISAAATQPADDDPRWPVRCDHCDYRFHPKEVHQLFFVRIYRTMDGREVTVHGSALPGIAAAPAGAMWYADWITCWRGTDGHCLVVMTPGGEWVVDGPSTNGPGNGPGWTRAGVPPKVTARPSIIAGSYHGFLTDGELVEA